MLNITEVFDQLPRFENKQLIQNLERFQSITEQLDFLKKFKEAYFDSLNNSLSEFPEQTKDLPEEQCLDKVFGEKLYTTLKIPESVYNNFFKAEENNPEFKYWFLQYNATLVLEEIKKERNITEKLNSPLRDQIIIGELKKIQNVEDWAEQLLKDGIIDIFTEDIDSKYQNEIAYLRIKANYYQGHSLLSIDPNQYTVRSYATHVYLKSFLEEEQQQFMGNVFDVVALNQIQEEKEEPEVNIDHLGPHSGHDFVPFSEVRASGIPVFRPKIIPVLCDVLQYYFLEQDLVLLELLLRTGDNVHQKLIFLSNGNKLADVFWQLYEDKLIFNCKKANLIQWISNNFQYLERQEKKDFTFKYLEKIISTDKQICKKPILRIDQNPFDGEKLLKHT